MTGIGQGHHGRAWPWFRLAPVLTRRAIGADMSTFVQNQRRGGPSRSRRSVTTSRPP